MKNKKLFLVFTLLYGLNLFLYSQTALKATSSPGLPSLVPPVSTIIRTGSPPLLLTPGILKTPALSTKSPSPTPGLTGSLQGSAHTAATATSSLSPTPQPTPAPSAEPVEQSLFMQTIAMDIDTANYYELVNWCRLLSIDDSGSTKELKNKLYTYYKIPDTARQQTGNAQSIAKADSKTIEIQSAGETGYYKDKNTKEDWVELTGNVTLVVKEEATGNTHRIKAEKIIINQAKNILTAEGNVEYQKIIEGSKDKEIYKGSLLSFNIGSSEGVFYKGLGETEKEVSDPYGIFKIFPDPGKPGTLTKTGAATTAASTPGPSPTGTDSGTPVPTATPLPPGVTTGTNIPAQPTATPVVPASKTTIQYNYVADKITRLENDIIILDNAIITNSGDNENPYWKIKAKHIYVLGPGEWALKDAVLYTGHIPLFYLPIFFYPGDELFFNPVIGYKNREGTYIQTTTYLAGSKQKTDTKDQSFSFLNLSNDSGADYEQVQQGLFLHKEKSDKTKSTPSKSSDYLKVMVDFYSRLGFFSGVDLSFEKIAITGSSSQEKKIVSGDTALKPDVVLNSTSNPVPTPTPAKKENLEVSLEQLKLKAGIGFSRTLVPLDSTYTWYFYDSTGTIINPINSSALVGLAIPFRYSLENSFNLAIKPVSFAGKFELASDPFFASDFYSRKEDVNWLDMLLSDNKDTSNTGTVNPKDSINWSLSINVLDNLAPKMLTPWIKKINLSPLKAELNWLNKSREITPISAQTAKGSVNLELYDPARKFFYPSKLLSPSNTKLTIDGELFSFPVKKALVEKKVDNKPVLDSKGYRNMLVPAGQEKKTKEQESAVVEKHASARIPGLLTDNTIKSLYDTRPASAGSTASLSYTIGPSFSMEHTFNSSDWMSIDMINYALLYSRYAVKAPVTLQFNSNLADKFLTVNQSATFDSGYLHAFNRGDMTEDEWDAQIDIDNNGSNFKINTTSTISMLPFIPVSGWDGFSIQYTLNSVLYNYYFDETNQYNGYWINPEKETAVDYFKAHTIDFIINLKNEDDVYSLSLKNTLPPLNMASIAAVSFPLGDVNNTLSTGIKEKYEDNTSTWHFEPFKADSNFTLDTLFYLKAALSWYYQKEPVSTDYNNINSTLKLFQYKNNWLFQEELIYNLDERIVEKFISDFSIEKFRITYDMHRYVPDNFDLTLHKWIPGEPQTRALLPATLSTSLVYGLDSLYFWKNRIKWDANINTSVKFDFNRVTDSKFLITFGTNFYISRSLNISFTATSHNNALWLYFQETAAKLDRTTVPFFKDLFDSFNIFNPQALISTSFKIDNITLKVQHLLEEWYVNLEFTGKYMKVQDEINMKWSPEFNIVIGWIPIPEIKKEISGNRDSVDIRG